MTNNISKRFSKDKYKIGKKNFAQQLFVFPVPEKSYDKAGISRK